MHGLFLLWWVEEKQLSPATVAVIIAVGDLANAVLEWPTGWLADRLGHRASLIAGSTVQVAGMLWCWLGEGVPSLVIASLLVAVGDAFRSGADQALLYRTCAALGKADAFQRIEARTHAVEQVALVGLVLAGGAIVQTWGFAAGWIAETALCAFGLAIACAMAEPPDARNSSNAHDPDTDARPAHGAAPATGLPAMLRLILPAAALGAVAGAAAFLAQTSGHTNPTAITVLVAAITLAEAAGSALATRLPASGVRGQMLFAGCGAVLVAMAFVRPDAFIPVVIALAVLDGAATPLRAAAIQRLAADDARARAASLASACDMALSTLVLPLAAWRR